MAVNSVDKRRFGRFIIGNVLASILVFPVIELVVAIVFFNNEFGFAAVTAVFAVLHFIVLWIGLLYFRRERNFVVPWVCVTAFVFLYNCHVDGVTESNSPFSNGIEFLDHHRWGITGYVRVFDNPETEFGPSFVDWPGLFAGIEFSTLLTIIVSITTMWIASVWCNLACSE